ncbi:LamG domain-containing protein, partial [Candidatus Woesearchaeota archaeon]|nr:LamG domain-containing protein [Candidatus Woesearchaeota archaeon]
YASIFYPSQRSQNLTLSLAQGKTYKTIFENTTEKGVYHVYIYSLDNQGNIAHIHETFFTEDHIPPHIENITFTFSSELQPRNFPVNVSAEVFDDVDIDQVYAQITFPNGSFSFINLTGHANIFLGNVFDTSAIGAYDVRIIAYDGSRNVNDSAHANFAIKDIAPPNVTALSFVPAFQNRTFPVLISAQAQDDVAVKDITTSITTPRGRIISFPLSGQTSLFSGTFLDTSEIGTYNIQVLARDTSNNINDKVIGRFTVFDALPPNITQITILPKTQNRTFPVSFSFIVTDDVGLQEVGAESISPLGIRTAIPLTLDKASFSGTVFITSEIGNYTLHLTAKDPSGNTNEIYENFTIRDALPPSVTQLQAKPNFQNRTFPVVISAVVQDDVAVKDVTADITNPLNQVLSIPLQRNANDPVRYSLRFTNDDFIGTYAVRIRAVDTSGNINDSAATSFMVMDGIPPVISGLQPTPNPQERTKPVLISADVRDDILVQDVKAILTYPQGQQREFSLSRDINTYSLLFADTGQIGTYHVKILATDTNNNQNEANADFVIVDLTPPQITILSPENNSLLYGDYANFSFTAADDVGISGCSYSIDGTTEITVPDCKTFMAKLQTGSHALQIFAKDTSSNIGQNSTSLRMTLNGTIAGKILYTNGSIAPLALVQLFDTKKSLITFQQSLENSNYSLQAPRDNYTISALNGTSFALAQNVSIQTAMTMYFNLTLYHFWEFPYKTDSNCIALYHFDGDLADSCKGFTGVDAGSNAVPSMNTFYKNAREFSGSQFINLPTAMTSSLGDQFTIDAWIKTPASFAGGDQEGKMIFVHRAGSRDVFTGYGRTRDGPSQEDKLFFIVRNPLGGGIVYGQTSLQPDTWNHVAFVSDGTNLKLYINGKLDTTNSVTGSMDWAGGNPQNAIGANPKELNSFFIGRIDELRISNVARNYD